MLPRLTNLLARLALAGALASGAALAQDAGKPQYGGQLIYAQSGEKFTLFMGRSTDQSGQDVWLHACETLVELSPQNEIKPLLAIVRHILVRRFRFIRLPLTAVLITVNVLP